jgi:hypothetical protein
MACGSGRATRLTWTAPFANYEPEAEGRSLIAIVHQPARGIGGTHRPIVAQRQLHEQQLLQALAQRAAPREERRRGQVEHHQVRLEPRLHAPDPVIEVQCHRRTARREIQRFGGA